MQEETVGGAGVAGHQKLVVLDEGYKEISIL